MANKKATIGQVLAGFALDAATSLAREAIARQFPELAKHLNAGDNYLLDSAIKASDKRRTKRKQNAPQEVRVSKGVWYTPPPNRR